MKIWTLTINDNDGTSTKVFTDRAALDEVAWPWVREAWKNHGDGKPIPETWEAAMEQLAENAMSFYDWIGAQEHEIEVPAPGLTKREIFAGHCMAGELAGWIVPKTGHEFNIASRAVACADALIEALKGT